MKKAFEWDLKAATKGNHKSQEVLFECYYYGLGVTKDPKEAVMWLRKAATNSDSLAQYNLGIFHLFGKEKG